MIFAYNADILPRIRMIGQIKYKEPWIHFQRCINEYVLYVIQDGFMYIREDGKEYTLKAGDFFILEPGKQHEGFQKASCSYYYVHFSHSDIDVFEDEKAALELFNEKRRKSLVSYNLDEADPTDSTTYVPKLFHIYNSRVNHRLISAIKYYNSREENYKRKASTELHAFLLDIAHDNLLSNNHINKSKVNKSEAIVEKILQFLNSNYSQKLTSRDIESMFEVNFDCINRVFAAKTGTPIFTYINFLRISNAKQLIATTELPFSEIGYLVGIEDRYYFSKLFKKTTGQSPTEYYREVRFIKK